MSRNKNVITAVILMGLTIGGVILAPSIAEAVQYADYPTVNNTRIGLKVPLEPVEMSEHTLIAPDDIAGIYNGAENKTLVIGHSNTAFTKLDKTAIGDIVSVDGKEYAISRIQVLPIAEIDMNIILQAEEKDTLIMMTCAGEPLPGNGATHRLIIKGERV